MSITGGRADCVGDKTAEPTYYVVMDTLGKPVAVRMSRDAAAQFIAERSMRMARDSYDSDRPYGHYIEVVAPVIP